MKTKHLLSLAVLVLILSAQVHAQAAPQIYDLKADWSEVANPNGVWSYRAGTTLAHAQASSPHTAPGQPVWMGPDNYLPIWFKYIGAPVGDLQTGDVCVHSANSDGEGIANIEWTAPAAGTIDVAGGAWIAIDQGRSSVWSLWLNATLLTSGEVVSGDPYDRNSPFQFSAGSGGAGVLQSVAVSAGDQLMLQVRKETGTYGTFVGINWTISLTSTSPQCADSPSGIAGWWRAEYNAVDSVGANHGTLQNGAAFTSGKVGQAFSLNGANQYVLIGDPVPPSLQIQNEITLSAWIYATAYPGGGTLGLIVGSQYDVAQAGATIFLDGRTNPDGQPAPPGHIHFQIGDGSWHTANANAQLPLNQWVHIAATRKANEEAKIYYNGVLQPSTSVPWSGAISYNDAWFAIGQQKDINRPFNGLIDEADIYNRALTAEEIQSIYAAGSAGKCVLPCAPAPAGAVAWWRAENNALDSQSANHGTLRNGTAFVSGRVGQAFNFDGVNDYVEVPDAADLRMAGTVAIEFWAMRTVANTLFIVAERGGDWTTGQANYGVGLHQINNSMFYFWYAGGWQGVNGQADLDWHHYAVVATHGQSTPIFYVDAVQRPVLYGQGATQISLNPSTAPLHIGAQVDPNSLNYFTPGMVDELSIYNRALTTAEIQSIYVAGAVGKCIPAPSCAPVPSESVAWWRGEGNAHDSVGTHQGATFNGATFASGKVGQAFSFDGVDDYVEVPHSDNFNPTGPFSVECWIRASTTQNTSDGYFLIVDKSHGWTDYTGWAVQGNPDGTVGFGFGNGAGWPPGAATLTSMLDNQWHHFVGVFTGPEVQLYLDGALQSSSPQTSMPAGNTRPVEIGRSWGGGSPRRYFHGLVDEVTYYSRALAAAEIQSIYLAGSAGKCTDCTPIVSGLTSWWQGEGNASDALGANNGSLHGGVTIVPGVVGQAFSFNGTDSYVEIPDSSSLKGFTDVSFEMWVHPNELAADGYCNGGACDILLLKEFTYAVAISANGRIETSFGNGTGWGSPTYTRSTGPITLGMWNHIAVVKAATTISYYINGTLAGTATDNEVNLGTSNPDPLVIGANNKCCPPGVFTSFFNGWIDEVKIYDRALSGQEIANTYNCQANCQVPSIASHPQNQFVCPGATATFTSSAAGTAPLSYQWSKDGMDVPGATSSTLTINPATTAHSGTYRVRVSNDCGQVESDPATLIVSDASPVITLNGPSPLSVEACAGPYIDPGASANDDCDGVVPVTIGGPAVNTAQPGNYLVSYSAMDSGGHTVTALRTVIVQDTQPPVFTTAPAGLTLTCGPDNAAAIDAWLASAVAADSCGAVSVTHTIAWSGPCGADSAMVTWTATDVHGLTATTTATLTVLSDRFLTGVQFDTAALQVTLPANTVQQATVTVRHSGACPTIVQSAQIAASFQSPGLTVLSPLPGTLCASASTSLAIQIDTTSALEGVYAATLSIHGADGGSQSLPIEIVVSGRNLPDLTANYTGGGISFQPESSPVFPVTDEPFTISAAVKNIGTAPAGAFTVRFFEGAALLGSAELAGLGLGQSTTATLEIPDGFPVDGFYLIRAEVVPPAGGELRLVNNSASALLQIGTPFTGTAFIRVTASLTPDCSLDSGTLAVHAEYVIVTDQATLTFPVQGGRVDALIQGTPFTVTGVHTDVGGNFSTGIGLPASGNYTLEVTVTDFTITETETFPVTVPSVPNCPQGGEPGGSGNAAPYVPPGESADLYLCSSDVSFRTGDGSMTLSAPSPAGQSVQICAVVNYYTSLGRELNSQPVHFTARRQTADSVEEFFIGTALANFAGGGSTTVCVPWTVPDEGTFVVSVSLAPSITQFEANDLATRALVSGNPAPPATEIHVTAEGAGCSPTYQWVSGRATYEKPGAPLIPVVCGQITVRAYDESATLLANVGGFSTDSAGNFGFNPRIPLPTGINRIVVEVTDGTLTGSTEFTIECAPSPNAPAPDAPPAPVGDLYVFSEHIAFLAADCLNSWNRNPLPGETISVAADIHYFDNYSGTPLNGVPVDVNVLIPIGDALQPFNIAHTTADFSFGGGSSIICVPWTPTVAGPQIVQVVIDPEAVPVLPQEYRGNNAATRLIFVGDLDVVLTADPREQRVRPGQSAQYILHGETLTAAHPTLNLAPHFEGQGTAPAGLTTSLAASSITLSGNTTLTLATTSATPPGSYRYYVVGTGDQLSAVARLTLIVEPPDTPLEIACPADIALGTDPGQCSAVVSFTVAATGGRSAPKVVCSPESGTTFSLGTTTVTCTATDTCGNSASCQFQVSVINPPPTVAITSPASGAIFAVGTPVTFSGKYADNAGDTHTGQFTADTTLLPTSLSGGLASAAYSFTTPGVYFIKLAITDSCGQSAAATTVAGDPAMVVVYDANAGFVTGGGWITSPAGAYSANPTASGKANFGFVSKYKKGASVPTGETEFQFQAGNFNFHSASYDWLVVSGAKAQYKGSGTVNGSGDYAFLLTATDGQISGGGGIDKFRIKVWDKASGAIVYDNVPGASDDLNSANPQAIANGSIVIHK